MSLFDVNEIFESLLLRASLTIFLPYQKFFSKELTSFGKTGCTVATELIRFVQFAVPTRIVIAVGFVTMALFHCSPTILRQ